MRKFKKMLKNLQINLMISFDAYIITLQFNKLYIIIPL